MDEIILYAAEVTGVTVAVFQVQPTLKGGSIFRITRPSQYTLTPLTKCPLAGPKVSAMLVTEDRQRQTAIALIAFFIVPPLVLNKLWPNGMSLIGRARFLSRRFGALMERMFYIVAMTAIIGIPISGNDKAVV